MMLNKDMTGGLLVVAGWGQYMTPEELLAITPEFLGKAILHRRERLAGEIPEQLDARSDELTEAAAMARSAKAKRDDVNKKVASLKKREMMRKQKQRRSSSKPIPSVTRFHSKREIQSQNLSGPRIVCNNAWMPWIYHSKQTGAPTSMNVQH